MKILPCLLPVILLPVLASAQTVKVVDNNTAEPIERVLISQGPHSAYTDANGQADISGFGKSGVLTFRHRSYQLLRLSYMDLEEAGFVVRLKAMPISFKTVVISANRWEENIREVPNKISVISAEDAELQNPQTTADLIGGSGEVYIQKSQLGGGSPMIRGFAANRVLLVADGVRMNNAIFRSGNLQNVIVLDANAIEGAEVIFGPGSVIYGSDAIGGVMDFHTLPPRFSESGGILVSSNVLARYASADTEKTGHFDLSVGGGGWASVSSATFSDYDDLRMGSRSHEEYRRLEFVERIGGVDTVLANDDPNVQKFSGYSQVNLMQKFGFCLNSDWELGYSFHYSRSSDTPRYDRLIQRKDGRLRYARWYYGPQKWLMHTLNLKYTDNTPLFDEAKLVLAYQRFEESRNDRKFGRNSAARTCGSASRRWTRSH